MKILQSAVYTVHQHPLFKNYTTVLFSYFYNFSFKRLCYRIVHSLLAKTTITYVPYKCDCSIRNLWLTYANASDRLKILCLLKLFGHCQRVTLHTSVFLTYVKLIHNEYDINQGIGKVLYRFLYVA